LTARTKPPRPTVVVVLACLALGCDQALSTAAPQELLADGSVAAGRVPSMDGAPLRIQAGATFAGRELAPGFGPPSFGRSTFDGRCSAPADFVIRFSLDGRATHLGHFEASAEHCSQIDFATGRTSAITDGVLNYRSADGDELWSTYHRGAEPVEHHEFGGGTGRFSGATGEGSARVSCDPSTGTCAFRLRGALVYDASDRSH
jgi:hypothetical protein